MEPTSFFHVAIKVEDVDAVVEFYERHFGATVLERGDASEGEGATAVTHAALEIADKRVYVFDRAPYEAAGLVDDVPTGFLHYGYVVEDVETASEELLNEGVEFVMEPTVFGDLKIAFLTDPAGVRIELLEHR
jgi:uncharacterized glyoxalase superfamily protein PhnB